jgi:RNA-directed DNA polymerase
VGVLLMVFRLDVVEGKDDLRPCCEPHEHTAFKFLGYTFQARGAQNENAEMFLSFLPTISEHALTKISAQVSPGGCITAPVDPSTTSYGKSIPWR